MSSKSPATAGPGLRLVGGTLDQTEEWGWFCGHCAAPSPGDVAPAPTARVCRSCGLGLLLETTRSSVPAATDPFLVVDSSLLVQAMSRRAETLLRVREDLAVNRPVTELLAVADADERPGQGLGPAIVGAIERVVKPGQVLVRPWNTFGVRMRARVSPCGPPRAALLVLESARNTLRVLDS